MLIFEMKAYYSPIFNRYIYLDGDGIGYSILSINNRLHKKIITVDAVELI